MRALGDRHVGCFCRAKGAGKGLGTSGAQCALCYCSVLRLPGRHLSELQRGESCVFWVPGADELPSEGILLCWTDPRLSPPFAFPWAPWGEGSDGTIAVEPRETSTALGFVMASGRICPRAGGDSHTFNYQYDQSEWMLALRPELDLEPPVVRTGTHFRGVGVGVPRLLWAGRQLLWHLPQGHPLTHTRAWHPAFSPLGSVSPVRWIGRWKSPEGGFAGICKLSGEPTKILPSG